MRYLAKVRSILVDLVVTRQLRAARVALVRLWLYTRRHRSGNGAMRRADLNNLRVDGANLLILARVAIRMPN